MKYLNNKSLFFKSDVSGLILILFLLSSSIMFEIFVCMDIHEYIYLHRELLIELNEYKGFITENIYFSWFCKNAFIKIIMRNILFLGILNFSEIHNKIEFFFNVINSPSANMEQFILKIILNYSDKQIIPDNFYLEKIQYMLENTDMSKSMESLN